MRAMSTPLRVLTKQRELGRMAQVLGVQRSDFSRGSGAGQLARIRGILIRAELSSEIGAAARQLLRYWIVFAAPAG